MRKIFFDISEKLCSHLLCVNELTSSVYTRVGFPGGLVVKNPPANAGDIRYNIQSLGQEDPLEEGMATYSSILAWRIPWREEPGGLQSMGSQRVRHD